MDMSKIKYIFSERYNQFYKPMRIDEDVGIIYMQATKNLHEKGLKKSEMLHIEDDQEHNYVVMHDANITAEKNFLKVMSSNIDTHVKLNEVKFFEKNLLSDSELAMERLKDLAENDKSDIKVHNAALKLYTKINAKTYREITCDNRATYNDQEMPNEIKRLALTKRLFVERSDDYCKNGVYRHPSNRAERLALQAYYPCRFIVKDRGGKVIAGKGYTMNKDNAIEFVKNYIPTEEDKHCTSLYRVPMSLRKKTQLAMCYKILEEYELHYKNEHNYFFWVLDKYNNVVAGGENGFGFKWLFNYCNKLKNQKPKKKKRCVTDNV